MKIRKNSFLRVAFLVPREGASGDGGTSTGGSGTPGGGDNQPTYVTAEDFTKQFGGVAAKLRGTSEAVESMKKSMVSVDVLIEAGLLERDAEGKLRKPQASGSGNGGTGNGGTGTGATGDGTKSPDVLKLEKQLESMQKQIRDRDEALQKADNDRKIEARRSTIISELTAANAVNAKRDARLLEDQAVTVEGREGYFVKIAGEFGEEFVPLKEFISGAFLKENPELFRPRQTGGSGTGGSGGQGGAGLIPFETWKNPEWYARNNADIISGKIKLAPRA